MISMRRFLLQRDVDVSDVSGTGVVADGVEFGKALEIFWPDGAKTVLPAGWVRLTWRTAAMSTALYASAGEVEEIHGHGGATRVVWLDAEPVEAESATRPLSEALARNAERRHERVVPGRGRSAAAGT